MSMADKLATIAANEQRVYDAGKEAQEQAFWDAYQNKGKRTNYETAFASSGWTNETFKPRYNIFTTNAYMMFRTSSIPGDLASLLVGLGVTLDFSQSTTMEYAFYYASRLTRLGVINCPTAKHLTSTFAGMLQLITIDKLILKDTGDQIFTSTFSKCEKLESITIEGVIGNNISFGDSPLLTHDSLINIISCLQDITGTSNTRTLTLGATNLAKLTDAEKAVATGKGWTLV